MTVIPVINCPDIDSVRERIEVAKTFLPSGSLLHLDVTDGVFSSHETWHDAGEWMALKAPFHLEAHLMVAHPGIYIEEWIRAGAKRCIIHIEAAPVDLVHRIAAEGKKNGVMIMLSSKPETGIGDLEPYISCAEGFQVLAVHPGVSGQEFMPGVIEKIKFLREHAPHATIEVDGGIDPRTAELVKAAGADTIVSEHYIFESENPKEAYRRLVDGS